MFSLLTPYIVLIERRRLARRLLAAIAAIAVAASGFAPTLAHARKNAVERGFDRVHKVARDLGDELDERASPKRKWSRKVGGSKVVQAVIVSDSPDPTMADLRAHVEQLGGSVLAVHGLVHAMTVQVPARHVRTLAATM
jgi:serine protease AprX